ncbi:MAG: thiamine pyrophosphate-dependent enzyme [Solirubrobacterales bacterium]
MEWTITANEPGATYLMQGNEAIARGAIEAGLRFAAAYPGSPSSEILGMLGRVAEKTGFYAEWSVNEVAALEACMGASFAQVRALCVMKQNGLLTVGDALHTAALSGCKGGVALVVADDPQAHSSTNEFDSRHQARSASLPLLEPATFQEAKDMVKWAFELSEQLQQVVMVRTTTRINHGRGNVELGARPEALKTPAPIGEWDRLAAVFWFQELMRSKLDQALAIFEDAPFNTYEGPDKPELVIATCGAGWFYSVEAVETLGVGDRVGILKIGTTWPLPEKWILSNLRGTPGILVVEEVDPFLEQNLSALLGRNSGSAAGIFGRWGQNSAIPRTGELNPDLVRDALAKLMNLSHSGPEKGQLAPEQQVNLPARDLTFCAGCPHRGSFFALKQAFALDGRGGVIMQDIGCYTMGGTKAGWFSVSGLGCMGGGVNMAEGLGQMTRFGFDQPVVALAGDSTFFHSCIPGLINAKYQKADMLFIVLDNSATAMTGFQPHPGIEMNCMGQPAEALSIERLIEAIGIPVRIADPYKPDEATEAIYRLIKQPGAKVLILRQACATLTARRLGKRKVTVDPEKCRGDECGCGRFCSRIWGCPGNIWDEGIKKAKIDEVVCIGCGVCAGLCPAGAIHVEGGDAE